MDDFRPYRVVCSDDDPEWLQHRTGMVTGSEMAIVLGQAPKWMKKTRADLLAEKRSGKPNVFLPTRRMRWGSLCEKANLRHFCEITGVRARSLNVLLQSTRCERIGGTLDGVCLLSPAPTIPPVFFTDENHVADLCAELDERCGEFGCIEMKQTDFLGGWKTGIPEYYQLQAQTQLFVTGYDWCLVVAKIGASDMRAYFVDADRFLHEEMEERVQEFWDEVSNGR